MLGHLKTRHAPMGFTLIELLVVIIVLGILTTIGIPSFQHTMANYKIRTAADGLLNGLQLARAEAIRLNTNVSFTLDAGSGWTVAVVSPAQTLQQRPASEAGANLSVSSLNSQDTIEFNSAGRVNGYNPSTCLTQVTISSPVSGTDSLRIDLFAGGQLRMCNLAITAADDPRRC